MTDVRSSCMQYDSNTKTYTEAKAVVEKEKAKEDGQGKTDNKAKENGAVGQPQVAFTACGIILAGLLAMTLF